LLEGREGRFGRDEGSEIEHGSAFLNIGGAALIDPQQAASPFRPITAGGLTP
jgi:hypothetical protein